MSSSQAFFKKANKLSILIVDDNAVNRMCARRRVKSLLGNVEIDEAENGQIGINKVHDKIAKEKQAKSYDIIFMDFEMPELQGDQATLLIRRVENAELKSDRHSFIITWSTLQTAPYPNADAVLEKPLKAEALQILFQEHGYLTKEPSVALCA